MSIFDTVFDNIKDKKIKRFVFQDSGDYQNHLRGPTLYIVFTDGSLVRLNDEPECCASKYFVCDDDLSSLVGATIIGGEVREGPTVADDYGSVHEQHFLAINTSKGQFVVSSHNKHNGYYGGIYLSVEYIAA